MNQSAWNVIRFLVLCTVFFSMAECDTCTYQSTCYEAQRYTTSCGFWNWRRCTRYRSVSKSCTQTSSCNYQLVSCSQCSKSCNGGMQRCRYQCSGSLCSLQDKYEYQLCNNQFCPIDGGWNSWTDWKYSSCTASCGGGTQFRNRNRPCNFPSPQYGGKECIGSSVERDTISCNTNYCPIDGGWSSWTDWKYNSCNVTCGGGTQIRNRTRLCNNPLPRYGGKECIGSPKESDIVSCNTNPCPIDGGWNSWTDWKYSGCNVTCGGGTQIRNRTRPCKNPIPQYGGKECLGSSTERDILSCNTNQCPIDGGWSSWTSWKYSSCNVTCGGGTQIRNRSRSCNGPLPQFGGKECSQNSMESETVSCNTNQCPIDGGWSSWTDWKYSSCNVTCGGGTQIQNRSRSCNNPLPQYGGKECSGSSKESETVSCNTKNCPIDGGWSSWTDWKYSSCNVTCGGGTQIRNRSRSCNNPLPQYGGIECSRGTLESETVSCNENQCPVDGGWSSWTDWKYSSCNVTCGGGTQIRNRSRSCNDPLPQFGGKECSESSMESETVSCNTNMCPIDGGWSPWTDWKYSSCDVTCGGGTQIRNGSRSCNNPLPQYGGEECGGSSMESETVSCNTNQCPIDGGWSSWTDWKYSICDVTCGGGTQIQNRSRSCNNPLPQYGGTECMGSSMELETVSCNTNQCPIDGGWSSWTDWKYSSCDVTCGGGTQIRNRSRSCNNPLPQYGGIECSGSSVESETVSCNENQCPVDGGWSIWTDWRYSSCNVTCGGGTQIRNRSRSCNDPFPQFGGKECSESSVESETVSCNTNLCPIDGGWSSWSNWKYSSCNVTCGGGIQIRNGSRSCNNPLPQYGGEECSGSSMESDTISCNTNECPIDGGWSSWADWTYSSCDETCGGGTQFQYRSRSCNNPLPQYGGVECSGISVESETVSCNENQCPVDGGWSIWTDWKYSSCNVTCDGGTQIRNRSRSCNGPLPQFGGKDCSGSSMELETISCNTNQCPIDGGWSSWTDWKYSSCNVTCGGGAQIQNRSRSCKNPLPQYGGKECNGSSMELETVSCNTVQCPIDGGWSSWTDWKYNSCDVTCGGGTQIQNRSRSCNNPLPQYGGEECSGSSMESETVPCNTNKCPIDGGWNSWTDWKYSSCDVTCGGGKQIRNRSRSCNDPLPQYGGKECNGISMESETVSCNENQCPIDGWWSSWSAWRYSTCSVTCGVGTIFRNRTRFCNSPMPQYGGKECSGRSLESGTISCNSIKCPINGNWTVWSNWTYGTCSATCGGGMQHRNRNRSCTNPKPQFAGKECIGNATESETISCNADQCPSDGGWRSWTDWKYSSCDVTCGGGTQIRNRTRYCNNALQRYEGKECNGRSEESETISCNTNQCPIVDGGWSVWGDWKWSNECSKSCNEDQRIRYKTRSCTNPAPSNGGQQCIGKTYQFKTIECNMEDCPNKSREYLNQKRLIDSLFSDEFKCANGNERENKKYCEKFQVCIDGKWQEMACDKGTVYNSATGACNWPMNVPGCTNTSDITNLDTETRGGDGFECKSVDCACEDIIDGITWHPTDCTKYIICLGRKHYVDSCDEGSYWEQSMFACQPGTC